MDSCTVSKIICMLTLFYLSTFNLSVLVLYWKSTKNALSRRDNTQIAKSDEKTQKGGYTKFSTSSRFMVV